MSPCPHRSSSRREHLTSGANIDTGAACPFKMRASCPEQTKKKETYRTQTQCQLLATKTATTAKVREKRKGKKKNAHINRSSLGGRHFRNNMHHLVLPEQAAPVPSQGSVGGGYACTARVCLNIILRKTTSQPEQQLHSAGTRYCRPVRGRAIKRPFHVAIGRK